MLQLFLFRYFGIFICGPGIYFDILVAFICVIVIYIFFGILGARYFRNLISYFGILLVFFSLFSVLNHVYCCILYFVTWLFCTVFSYYCMSMPICIFVFGISVCHFVFLYSCIFHLAYVHVPGMSALWLCCPGFGRRVPCVVKNVSRTFSKRSLGCCTRVGRIV